MKLTEKEQDVLQRLIDYNFSSELDSFMACQMCDGHIFWDIVLSDLLISRDNLEVIRTIEVLVNLVKEKDEKIVNEFKETLFKKYSELLK